MPTRAEVLADIASKITDKTAAGSLTNTDDGANRVLILDYTDQEVAAAKAYTDGKVPTKTSAVVTLTGTQTQLPNDINFCNFTGGKAYLPATTMIGREYIVLAVSNNIEIFANVANDTKMFVTYPTLVASVVLTTNQMYRFTYLGIGTGGGGVVDGYWKAELMN